MGSYLETVVHKALPERRFETYISQAVILPDLSGRGKTLFQLPRYNKLRVAGQYLALAQEVEYRVMNRVAFLAGTLPVPVLSDTGFEEEETEGAMVANA